MGAVSGRNNILRNNHYGNVTDIMNSKIQEEHASQQVNVFGLLCLGKQRCTKVEQKELQDSMHHPTEENFDSPIKICKDQSDSNLQNINTMKSKTGGELLHTFGIQGGSASVSQHTGSKNGAAPVGTVTHLQSNKKEDQLIIG